MPPEPKLEYERREGFISRKQYRRLMALTLVNTVLLAGFVVGPGVGPMVRNQWQQYQGRRAEKATRAAQAELIARGKAYVAPQGLVVYEERPDRAAKLLADQPSQYRVIPDLNVPYLTPKPWQPPVELKQSQVRGFSTSAAFVGGLLDPQTGQRRAVVVNIRAEQKFDRTIDGSDTRRTYRVLTTRMLVAQIAADGGGRYQSTALQLDPRGRTRTMAVWKRGSADFEHGQVEYTPRGLFCIYAGRPDPADPSHFTIDYELDDQRGTIDGWLQADQRVELCPRSGGIVDRDPQGRNIVWDPTLTPPTTVPSATAANATRPNG